MTNRNRNIGSNNSQNSLTTDFPLTDLEKKVFSFLLEVVRHYRLGTTLRVAGGWVRDKVARQDKKKTRSPSNFNQ
jgi:hypothetical protein